MTKSLFKIAAGAFAFLATSTLASAEPVTFQRDGVAYTYTVTHTRSGQLVRGTADNGRVPFDLYVGKTRVTGTYDGRPVRFPVSDAGAFAVASR